MSQRPTAFLSRLADNADMQAELTQRLSGSSNSDVMCEGIAEFARSRGYDVSAEDLASMLFATAGTTTGNGEIAEEELQAVSGGTVSWSEMGKAFDFIAKLFGNRQ